jgi:hypothetical protein
MNHYKRPEKETDPAKYPGQIINRPPSPDTLKHNIEEWKKYEAEKRKLLNPDWCVNCTPDGRDGTEVCPGCGQGRKNNA